MALCWSFGTQSPWIFSTFLIDIIFSESHDTKQSFKIFLYAAFSVEKFTKRSNTFKRNKLSVYFTVYTYVHKHCLLSWKLKEKISYKSKCLSSSVFLLHQPGCFGYPLSIFFIVINEFCERFSYYGMRGNFLLKSGWMLVAGTTERFLANYTCFLPTAVLVLYFTYFLKWDDNLATAIYHTFVALCYLTPILGAIVADSWLGKFK